ncbi:MAG: putative nucleotidyltransferase with HDIG domain, partial [Phenylobacterium sp.]
MTSLGNICNSGEDNSLTIELLNNELYKQIISTDAFQRLRNISFLGAIDKTHNNRTKIRSDRFEHSIDVAKLALYICKERQYNKEIEEHVVVAALLHDIGHAPLSHSMESEFEQQYGINHHIASSQIINGMIKKHSSINKIINSKLDIDIVLDLIEQKSNECFSDIFSSPINVDTIDGIHKSLKYLKPNSDVFFNKYLIAKASFFEKTDGNRSHALDEF